MTLCAKECGMLFIFRFFHRLLLLLPFPKWISEKYGIRSVHVYKQSNRKTTKPLALGPRSAAYFTIPTHRESCLPLAQTVTLKWQEKLLELYSRWKSHCLRWIEQKRKKKSAHGTLSQSHTETDIIYERGKTHSITSVVSSTTTTTTTIAGYYTNRLVVRCWNGKCRFLFILLYALWVCVCWIQCEPTELHF